MAENNKIKLKICLPQEVFMEEEVDRVQIPAFNGDITILLHRAPEVFVLGSGFIRVFDEAGKVKNKYFIEGGVADYLEGICKLIVEKIVEYKYIDINYFENKMDNAETEKEKSYFRTIIDIINLEKTKEI